MEHKRIVIGYHGCDTATAEAILAGRSELRRSENAYDWLGSGIYFWEYALFRAYQFAKEKKARGEIGSPCVIGALIDLGNCFDLLDARYTQNLRDIHRTWVAALKKAGAAVPKNLGGPDRVLRHHDRAFLNWYFTALEENTDTRYDTVRGAFSEGETIAPGSDIKLKTHVQVAVRNPRCVVGVFRPTMRYR